MNLVYIFVLTTITYVNSYAPSLANHKKPFNLLYMSDNSPNRINIPSLRENSLWKITLKFRKQGYKDIDATARIRFIQATNYEPPQGKVFVEDDYNALIKVDEQGYAGKNRSYYIILPYTANLI